MIPILDNGHGGVINGIYVTKFKRSPNWDKGVLYEGEFNRWIVNTLSVKLKQAGIPYYNISPELSDVSLNTRIDRANKIFKDNPNTYGISIHANAGGGTGFEVFTSPGQTKSDEIAELIIKKFEEYLPLKGRYDIATDGDKDKEAKFKLIVKTKSPFILVEVAFMDNKKDYDLLWDLDFRMKVVNALYEVILILQNK
jgi:N-acetylmuramoyl-L-alanine amidase